MQVVTFYYNITFNLLLTTLSSMNVRATWSLSSSNGLIAFSSLISLSSLSPNLSTHRSSILLAANVRTLLAPEKIPQYKIHIKFLIQKRVKLKELAI